MIHNLLHAKILSPILLSAVMLFGCSAPAAVPSEAPSSSAHPSVSSTSSQSASASDPVSTELFAMDTVMSLSAYGPYAQEALDNASEEIQRLDALLSISSPTSDILKANETGEADLSNDTQTLLEAALTYYNKTGGLFDITIEPVMEAWGFPSQNYRVPSSDELSALLAHVDASQISLEGNHVTLPSDIRLDLGGIAKGFTSSRVMDIFRQSGVVSGIISLGGNVQALGAKPDGSAWRVGIIDPRDLNSNFAVVEITDEAVITSGAYQRYFEQDGKHYHHIIDPRTGYPSDSGLSSVTIISKDGTQADALSTSLFIMGAEDASDFWQQHRDEFDTIMMADDGTVYVTAGLADRCQILTDEDVVLIQ